jgi:hypothetical protein
MNKQAILGDGRQCAALELFNHCALYERFTRPPQPGCTGAEAHHALHSGSEIPLDAGHIR